MESADVRAVVLAVCSNILCQDLSSKQSQKNGNGVLFAVKVKCPCMAHEHKLHIAHECDAKHTEPARLHGDLHLYCPYEVGATQNSFRLMTHPRTKHTRGFIMHKTSTDWCLMCPSHSRRAQWIHVMFVCTNTHIYIRGDAHTPPSMCHSSGLALFRLQPLHTNWFAKQLSRISAALLAMPKTSNRGRAGRPVHSKPQSQQWQ